MTRSPARMEARVFQKDRTRTTASARQPLEGRLTAVRVHRTSQTLLGSSGAGVPASHLPPF